MALAPEVRYQLASRYPKTGADPETYIKGKWVYLYRAIDKEGNTVDFYLSTRRNAKSAYRFLKKALKGLKDWEKPVTINTDKAPSYIEVMYMFKKGQFDFWKYGQGLTGNIRLITDALLRF